MIGVSRAYKESSNCRMEAQYALQKKKPLVPLMLVEGYEADGWLGLLLGTSMWYGFYGATLSSASAFEGRVDALSRELGDRGRADVANHTVVGVDCGTAGMETIEHSSELWQMKLLALQRRATAAGVAEDSMELAMESADQRASLAQLITQAEGAGLPRD